MALQAVKHEGVDRPVKFAEWTQPFEIALRDVYQELYTILSDQSEDLIKAVWLHMRRNVDLQACTQESIKAAVIELAFHGLDITQPGEAWLIPHDISKKDEKERWYKSKECIVWDGYIGRLKLARAHPSIQDVDCLEVREGDTYRYRGYHALPIHEHPENFGRRGRILGAYGYAIFTNGTVKCLQMSLDEILAHRDQYSKAAQTDVWQERIWEWRGSGERREKVETSKENRGFAKMCCKVVSNQLCSPRHLPMDKRVQKLIERQEQVLASLRPVTGEDMQPQEPVAITGTATADLFPNVKTPRQEALLAKISKEFGTYVAPLQGRARYFLAQACFAVEDWKALPALPLADLEDGNRRWQRLIKALQEDALPEEHGQWTDPQWFDWFLAHCHIGEETEANTTAAHDSVENIRDDERDTQKSAQNGDALQEESSMLKDRAVTLLNQAQALKRALPKGEALDAMNKALKPVQEFNGGKDFSPGEATFRIENLEAAIAQARATLEPKQTLERFHVEDPTETVQGK